jgi:4-aminobutyrate aminotransferase-like enzyme
MKKIIAEDKKYMGRDIVAQRLNIVRAKESYLYDRNGRQYIDFLMGWCVGNLGWGQKDIENKVKKFTGPNYVNPMYLYERWIYLAKLLADITPQGLVRSFRATGGTEAVEIALQASMSYTKRSKFISIEGSYHGHSIGAMSVGGSYFKEWYPRSLFQCTRIKPPLDEKSADKIINLLSKKDVAGLIMEPIILNLGVVSPEKIFMQKVAQACRQYGTLLIIDEVASGFGRTGKMLGIENFPNVYPDIICMAKGITGGYGSLGATIMTEAVAKSMEYEFSFYSTFGWHPLSVEASIANIEYLVQNKKNILSNVAEISNYISDRLHQMKFKHPVDIRIRGLAIGIECSQPGYITGICQECEKRGLLFGILTDNIVTMFPALNVKKSIAVKAMDILEKSLL